MQGGDLVQAHKTCRLSFNVWMKFGSYKTQVVRCSCKTEWRSKHPLRSVYLQLTAQKPGPALRCGTELPPYSPFRKPCIPVETMGTFWELSRDQVYTMLHNALALSVGCLAARSQNRLQKAADR